MTIDFSAPGVASAAIGDIIPRWHLLNRVRPFGRIHVYIGHAPDGYAGGLRL